MRRLLNNLFIFLIINLAIFFVVLQLIHFAIIEKNWHSDPDIFIIPKQKTYQTLFMGTSHARIFTRYNNHNYVEKILHQKIFNLSQPDAGPLMEKIYLQFFLEKGNHADTIVYFLDPHVFYSNQWNEKYHLLPYGELDPNFQHHLLINNIGYETSLDYVKTYLSLKWFIKTPKIDAHDYRTAKISELDQENRLKMLYPDSTNNETFIKYEKNLNEIIEIAKINNMKILFVIPTTKLKKQPGMDRLKTLLIKYKKEKNINFYDYSHAITNPKMYSDADHLNTKGVIHFSEKYLNTIPELKQNELFSPFIP